MKVLSPLQSRTGQIVIDASICVVALMIAYLLRFEGRVPELMRQQLVSVAPVVDFVTPTYGGRKPMTTGRAPRRAEPDHARVVVVPGVGVTRNASRRCSVETPLLH